MPTYSLICEDCSQGIEVECYMSEYDAAIKNLTCPSCTSRNIHRDYQEDNIHTYCVNVTTIGQLADRNTKKMKSQLEEEDAKRPKVKVPWHHEKATKTNKEIGKMTPERKKKYIMEGK